MTKKIYLAGPDVFLPNARAQLMKKADLVRAAGFIALSPGDLEIPPQPTKHGFGLAISAVDEQMMLDADGVIANLTPFRGICADPGTVFELGFMCALNKTVYGYTNVSQNHYQRTIGFYNGDVSTDENGQTRGSDGLSLENFEMAENLMLDGGIERRGGVFVVHNAAPEELYTDLTGFIACLDLIKQKWA
jgi:nucleoside 2-deoxyribosyltransferase